MKVWKRKQRLVALALAIALLASLTLVNASGLAVVEQEILVNGDFEGGFTFVPGCGAVGTGWGCFNNGGSADYGFYDDQWSRSVLEGSHSQLIEINTQKYAGSEGNRYAGIYQTLKVVKGAEYSLALRGLMREANPWPNDEQWRYRFQYGWTVDGSTDWTKVENWVELPWDKIDDRTDPGKYEKFVTSFKAPSDKITFFVRAWKKWGTTGKEVDFNLDLLSIWGPAVKGGQPVVVDGGKPQGGGGVVVVGGSEGGTSAQATTCTGTNLIANGDFEDGFTDGVGNKWRSFNNGGRANYGFYDDMWPPVVKTGKHSQLIEINTKGMAAGSKDRRAGIQQTVSGLKKDAVYELSFWGMMREEAAHPDEDKYRYRVEWGYVAADASPGQGDITNWAEVPWDDIYLRTEPGNNNMSFFKTQIKAPSTKIVVAIRAWKKWGTAERELDVNIDAVKLVPCGKTPAPPPPPPGNCFTYKVARGDTLYKIAVKNNDTVAGLVERNKLKDPNKIYVGQKLVVCDP